jgi:hypothetical protein
MLRLARSRKRRRNPTRRALQAVITFETETDMKDEEQKLADLQKIEGEIEVATAEALTTDVVIQEMYLRHRAHEITTKTTDLADRKQRFIDAYAALPSSWAVNAMKGEGAKAVSEFMVAARDYGGLLAAKAGTPFENASNAIQRDIGVIEIVLKTSAQGKTA